MSTKTVKLSQQVDLHGPINEIVLNEPTGGMFLDLGEPRMLAQNADGTLFWVEDKIAIKGYLGQMVEHDAGIAVVRLCCVDDVKLVKQALFDFFDGGAKTSKQ